MAEEADKLARSIEERVDSDREKLTLLAEILAMGEEARRNIWRCTRTPAASFPAGTAAARGPGGHRRRRGGQRGGPAVHLHMRAARGAHVTDRETDLDGQSPVVRHYVPVVRQGQTAALLCGVMELGELAQELPYQPYGGQTASTSSTARPATFWWIPGTPASSPATSGRWAAARWRKATTTPSCARAL